MATLFEKLSEAEKMRRVPGIVFVDSPAGRRARIDGTNLDVWELVSQYWDCGNDRTRFYEAFDWLTPEQFNAAFNYYQAFPHEFDEKDGREASHSTPDRRKDAPRRGLSPGHIAPL